MLTTLRARHASLLPLVFACLVLLLLPVASHATTAPDLRGRIVIDGYTSDWSPDENVFGDNGTQYSQEPTNDSRWGQYNDLSGFRVTWDRRALYVAAEGVIWDNNMVLLIDILPGEGFADMSLLDTWRRIISFSPGFAPDLFLATWDGNAWPRLLRHIVGNQMNDQPPGVDFEAVSTFSQGNSGRAMEARIPWSQIVRFRAPGWVRDTVIAGQPDTLSLLPPGSSVRLAQVLTAGTDGSGGPDVAPNNSNGCSDYAGVPIIEDNFAIIPLDVDNDGLPDLGASPLSRVTFNVAVLPVRRSSWGALKTSGR
ncbi:MAG: hypothetical protein IPJ04_17580 [Candidatus Eisenbacteria bacterium]|nr:hypothetical protein [Candidatus Eisenbacteria bacterium]